jgi:hypothetical protein
MTQEELDTKLWDTLGLYFYHDKNAYDITVERLKNIINQHLSGVIGELTQGKTLEEIVQNQLIRKQLKRGGLLDE